MFLIPFELCEGWCGEVVEDARVRDLDLDVVYLGESGGVIALAAYPNGECWVIDV